MQGWAVKPTATNTWQPVWNISLSCILVVAFSFLFLYSSFHGPERLTISVPGFPCRGSCCWTPSVFAVCLIPPSTAVGVHPRNHLHTTSFRCMFKLCLQLSFCPVLSHLRLALCPPEGSFVCPASLLRCSPCLTPSAGRREGACEPCTRVKENPIKLSLWTQPPQAAV